MEPTNLPGELPQDLLDLRQWVAWWSVTGRGAAVTLPNGRATRVLEPRPKPHKLPINAITGGLAMANNPATWTTFQEASRAVERFGVTGVGFVFAPGGAFTGIDLDDCRDPETGVFTPSARQILDEFRTYSEISPSGRGVKLIVRGTPPDRRGRRRKYESGEIEMYCRDRYFTITGDRVPGAPAALEDRSAELLAFYNRIFGAPPPPALPMAVAPRAVQPAARPVLPGSPRFQRLWNGDTSGYGGDDSRADLALCRSLARHTGNNAAQIDSLFRLSGLYRPKWERADYRERTIAAAIAKVPRAPGYRLTDMGNVQRLVDLFAGELRFCHDLRRWMAWDGVRWSLDAAPRAVECAKQTVLAIHDEAEAEQDEDKRKRLRAWALRSQSATRIFAIVRLAESHPQLAVSAAELDADPWMLNCLNGVVNLRGGALAPHNPEWMLTRLCPVEYDPARRSALWENFLAEVFEPHPELIGFLQRAAGYSLTGATREECLFLLYGSGRNGKGVFIRTLMEMLGDYACTADFSTFTASSDRGGPRDDVANLRGRHLVSAQEGREGGALAESLVKWLTGGDLVRARRLYENSYEFQPTHKLWLATNHKPAVRGGDPAIWNRIKLIPFDVSFEGRENRGLKEAMRNELAGVLAWAVEGCLRWQEDGLQFPDAVRDATAAWRNEQDQVARFIDERCVTGEFASASARRLYREYRRWSEEIGEDPHAEFAFGQRVAAKGFARIHRKDGNWYEGVGMKGEAA